MAKADLSLEKLSTTMQDSAIQIQRIGRTTVRVPIVGTSPLIIHRFSEKSKKQMLDTMQGKKSPRENKDPEAEYEAAAYRFEDGGFGFPAIAFKQATVAACRYFSQIAMTQAKQCLFFNGEVGLDGQKLVRIVGEPVMREDVVTVGRGGTDLRYRPEFREWSAELEVVFLPSMLDVKSVLALIEAGGMGVGVGEWRPTRDGDFGTFMLDPDRAVEFVEEQVINYKVA